MERLLVSRDLALGEWLAGRRPDAAVLIAARSALRTFPLLYTVMQAEGDGCRGTVLLPALRCLSLAWVAGRYRRFDDEFRLLGARARDSAALAANGIAKHAAVSAVSAAVHAAESLDDSNPGFHATVEKAARTAIAAAHDVAGVDAAEEMRLALVDDAAAIERGRPPHGFEAKGLWRGAAPLWVSQNWVAMSQSLLRHRRENWDVWARWYLDRLTGERARADVEHARARIPDEIWMRGPTAVNAEIRRIEDGLGNEPGDDGRSAAAAAAAAGALRADTVGRVVASRPREIALSAAVEHERIARLIEDKRASLPNDPDRLEEVRHEIAHLEALLPDLDAVSDKAAALPGRPTPADAAPVAQAVISLGDRVEHYVAWVVGPERSPAVVNTALIGGLFAFLTLCGMPPAYAAPTVIASITGPKVWERIKGMLGKT